MSIEAMKLALEALQFGLHVGFDESSERQIQKGGKAFDQHNQAITALRQAIEQAQQTEPVVWMYQDKSTHEVRFQKHMSEFVDHSKTSEVPLYGEPLANHELQCVCGAVWCGDEMVHLPNKTPPRQPLEGVIDVQHIGYHSLQLIFRSQTDIAKFKAAHGIKGEA